MNLQTKTPTVSNNNSGISQGNWSRKTSNICSCTIMQAFSMPRSIPRWPMGLANDIDTHLLITVIFTSHIPNLLPIITVARWSKFDFQGSTSQY